MELQRDLDQLEARGIKLTTISYDTQEILKTFGDQNGITFTMLSDPGSVVIERFDLLNPVPEWSLAAEEDDPALQDAVATYVSVGGVNERTVRMAFPGTLMLDANGRVVERHFEDSYVQRNTISSILLRRGEHLEPLEATRVSTDQLDLTTFPSSSEVAPGNRFTLVLNIEPHAGMHVYAPGAENYRAIKLNIEPQPFLSVLPMAYPESGAYYFQPFDETVPVYEEPFTLLQEVILEGTREAQGLLRELDSVTIRGTLEFQACDDEICYLPASVPLSWTMGFRSLIR